MKRRLLAAVAVGLVMCLGGGASVSAASPPTTPAGFTQMFEAKNDWTWSGSDGMASLRVPTGFTYWFTGDVFQGLEAADGSYAPGTRMIGNTILLQKGSTLVNALENAGSANNPQGIGVPNPPTHTESNNERYWALGGFFANGHLYVLSQRVINSNNGIGFEVIGVELAKYIVRYDGRLTLTGIIATPSTGKTGVAGPKGIQWSGDAIVGNGWVYVYGYTLAKDNPYTPHFSYVARVDTFNVEKPSSWTYYKASTKTWVPTIGQLNGDDLVNQPDAILPTQVGSARWINGKMVILDKPWNGWGSGVWLRTAPSPVGPWTSTKVMDSPAGTYEGKNYTTYGPMLHPEQKLTGGKLLISIDYNGVDFWTDTLGNADLYKPRFFAINQP